MQRVESLNGKMETKDIELSGNVSLTKIGKEIKENEHQNQ